MMKQLFVGTFRLGHQNVDLYALPDEAGGEFYCTPDDKSLPRIKVGIQSDSWHETVSVLIHESFELAAAILRVRFERDGVRGDAASYLFSFDHSQFCDLCNCTAEFITPALPKLATIYNRQHPKAKQ